MKKLFSAIVIIITCLILSTASGCSIKPTDIPITKKKPSNFYYTDILANNIISVDNITGTVFEMNLHKEKDFPKEGYENIIGFLKTLKSDSFISKPSDLPTKPQYKLFFTTKDDKYVINIYNDKYVTIHPWDGIYNEDFIDMSNTTTIYNLYGLCKYIFK